MPKPFNHILIDYIAYLRKLSGRLFYCAPWTFIAMLPVVLVNQVSMILAFMLPLKIIILLGSDGMPRYLRVFFSEMSRDTLIMYLGLSAFCFLLIYMLGNRVVKAMSFKGGDRVLDNRGGLVSFDSEREFAANVFSRVVQSWGTSILFSLGLIAGVLLEWRLVLAILVVLIIEVIGVAKYWNRHLAPEHIRVREAFFQNRVRVLQILNAINIYVALAVLVALFILEPQTNFIIGLVLFILTRHILQRLVKATQDATYLMQNKDKIEALVFPGKAFFEEKASRHSTLEDQLMPEQRGKLFNSIFTDELTDLGAMQWHWSKQLDDGSRLYSTLISGSSREQFHLKIFNNAHDKYLMREVQLYELLPPLKSQHMPTVMGSGSAMGRGFIVLKTPNFSDDALKPDMTQFRALRNQWITENLELGLASLFSSADPSQIDRLRPSIFKRMGMILDAGSSESQRFEELIKALPNMRELLKPLPRVLINRDMKSSFQVTAEGQLICLSWGRTVADLLGVAFAAGISVQQGIEILSVDQLLEVLELSSHPELISSSDVLMLSFYLALLERSISNQDFLLVFELLEQVLRTYHCLRG